MLHFLFYGACAHRKNIKMSNWSTEKTKRAPRTKSIQALKEIALKQIQVLTEIETDHSNK